LYCSLGHGVHLLGLLDLLDFLDDGGREGLHVGGVLDHVHVKLQELVGEPAVQHLLSEELIVGDAHKGILLHVVPLERVLVLPTRVLHLLA